ncbi:hypothetical protein ILUMI_23485 [Ignelater luminosus]|uniref:DDE Tnp4 domain-containing protein n=1 Tax=Ignelater luminosus TaxID=2038154 RepID=A0A8K0C8Q3_IGNLU|nr:hypothetical protein ILUMI_23485 [Ignelater luminosus]
MLLVVLTEATSEFFHRGGENGEVFRNRKGYFSINVQAVCDADLKIKNIDARWPGAIHDSSVWNASLLSAQFEAGEFPGCLLLGDSAYALKDYMMTPLLNPTTSAEQNYNNAHIQTRNCIERCFGVWKRRFACLSLGLRTKVDTTLVIIVATAVLHNIAINENDTNNFEDVVVDEEVEQEVMQVNNGGGNAVRRALIENVFANL